ncbi:MAG: MlaD family protein [Parvularculaceae bacterium]
MDRTGILETLVGIVVVAVAALFLAYAYSMSDKDFGRGAYTLDAVFGRVDGVTVGSEVRIAGVRVGAVSGHSLDTKTYEARLKMNIDAKVPVPEDSIAKIVSDGLLGGAHVAIEPGASDIMLEDGEVITITQGSVDLLGLAMKAFTENSGGDGKKSDESDPLGGLE